ncbi:transglycosylase SLT domain-containing protein [Micromonospora sp. NPDC049679]|uniref:transglycosylase SLT domain-containing protein n=1 Tax=Micromonospora sp. NPDC049679 TaxID=3155920 RepID=UPI0033F1B777
MRSGARGGAAVVVLTMLASVVAGCGNDRPAEGQSPVAITSDVAAASPTTEPTVVPTTAAPTRSATASPTPRPSRTTKAPAKPAPRRKPPTEVKLPPPVPKPAASNCTPKRVGTQVSRAEAKKALTDAAGRTYWPTSAPSIRVPLNLVKATAWQESGWQSNIIACDTGVGLMQVMPDTAEWMNGRFGQSYDINDYRDNATLGANVLAWLIKYFGDVYFDGDYTLDAADCADHRSPCLLNAIIASYNYGYGAVDTEKDGIVIPNPRYVENVRALMTECECLAF